MYVKVYCKQDNSLTEWKADTIKLIILRQQIESYAINIAGLSIL